MKNLTKKLVAVAAATVLTIAMGITSFAAGSPVAGVTTDTPGVTIAPMAVETPSVEKIDEILKAVNIQLENVEVLSAFDLSGIVPVDGKVTLSVPGITENTKVAVLHLPDGATEWKVEKSVAHNGSIDILDLESFSPFVIAVDKTTVAASSPKTGETSGVVVIAFVALCAGAVAFTTSKKRA